MAQQIQLRHDTAANWTSVNPTLMLGEFGYESDTQKCKIGDGATAWASLAYVPLPASLITGILGETHGGTNQSSYAKGDTLYSSATNTLSKLSGNTTTTKKYLTQTGDGTNSAAPAWATIAAADVPTLNQSTTGNAATATAPATGSAHGAVALDSTGAFKSVAPGTSGNVLQSNGTDWVSAAPGTATYTAPTIQKFTSGSGTYTKPAGVLYLRVRMVGGGGGGSGAGGTPSGQTAGGPSTFGTSLLTANGGGAATTTGNGGSGGTASLGTGPIGVALTGAAGGNYQVLITSNTLNGTDGGSSAFGGAGRGGTGGLAGTSAVSNTGSGGGGAGSASSGNGQSGGGAGGFVDAIITSPASSYSYAVGTGGTAGTGTTANGGGGGSGIIEVEEFYQ